MSQRAGAPLSEDATKANDVARRHDAVDVAISVTEATK